MRRVADVNLARRALHLRVAFQAEVQIVLKQQLAVHRTVRVVANRAALPQSLVFEHKWPCLLAMTLRAILIESRHSQPAGRFKNITTMRIVTLHAIHLPLYDWMMLRHSKLGFGLQMTLKTGAWILARINNEFAAAPACFNMLASRPMARFAPSLTAKLCVLNVDARVGTGRENARDIRVTLGASVIANVSRSWNIRRRNYGSRDSRTRDGEKHNQQQSAESRRHRRNLSKSTGHFNVRLVAHAYRFIVPTHGGRSKSFSMQAHGFHPEIAPPDTDANPPGRSACGASAERPAQADGQSEHQAIPGHLMFRVKRSIGG